jgi:hypothetical protein
VESRALTLTKEGHHESTHPIARPLPRVSPDTVGITHENASLGARRRARRAHRVRRLPGGDAPPPEPVGPTKAAVSDGVVDGTYQYPWVGELPAVPGHARALPRPLGEGPRPRAPQRRLRPRRRGRGPAAARPARRGARGGPACAGDAGEDPRPLAPRRRRRPLRPRRDRPRPRQARGGPAPAGARRRHRQRQRPGRDRHQPGHGAVERGPRPPRARALVEQTRAYYEHLGHRPGVAFANRWLAGHGPDDTAPGEHRAPSPG